MRPPQDRTSLPEALHARIDERSTNFIAASRPQRQAWAGYEYPDSTAYVKNRL